MKRASWFVAAAVLAAACSDSTRPTSDTPSAPNIAAAPPPPSACSFKDARDFSNAFFKLAGDRKTAADFLKAADDAGAGTGTRNDRFFDLFRLIESARRAGQINAGSIGASLILEAVDCGAFTISHHDAQLPAVLATALTTGAWAYRAGTEGFVATQDGGAAIFAADPTDIISPIAGIWNTWIGGRSMIIGARFSVGFTETTISPLAYRFAALYDATTLGPSGHDDIATVELCQLFLNYEGRPRLGRVRASGAQTVLQVGDIADFCPPGGIDLTAGPGGVLARAVTRIARLFLPTSLHARRRAPPGMGGDIGDISDFIGVDAGSVNLSFPPSPPPSQPVSGDVDSLFVVRVLAVAAQGTPLENVAITLAVAGNSGTPAGAELVRHPLSDCPGLTSGGTPLPDLTVNTDETGTATFCVGVNKPGGYTISASSDFAGYPGVVILSNLFNRTP